MKNKTFCTFQKGDGAIIWNSDCSLNRRNYASIGLNESMSGIDIPHHLCDY